MNDTKLEIAKRLAATVDYDYAEFTMKWKSYDVYFVCNKAMLDTCYGFPTYVLVNDKNKARFADFPTEVNAILEEISENDKKIEE